MVARDMLIVFHEPNLGIVHETDVRGKLVRDEEEFDEFCFCILDMRLALLHSDQIVMKNEERERVTPHVYQPC